MRKMLEKHALMDLKSDMQIQLKLTVKNTFVEQELVPVGEVSSARSKHSRSEPLKSCSRALAWMTMSEDSQTTLTPPDSHATAAEASPHDGPSAVPANAAPAGLDGLEGPRELPGFPYCYPAPGAAYVPGDYILYDDVRDSALATELGMQAFCESASSGSVAPAAQELGPQAYWESTSSGLVAPAAQDFQSELGSGAAAASAEDGQDYYQKHMNCSCRPCVFFWRGLCNNGGACPFCHEWHYKKQHEKRPCKRDRDWCKDIKNDAEDKGASDEYMIALSKQKGHNWSHYIGQICIQKGPKPKKNDIEAAGCRA